MADNEHLAKFMEGHNAWNKWRVENPAVTPNLSGGDFEGADLSETELYGANLRSAHFSGANLSGADLRHTDLLRAVLIDANLTGADLSNSDLKEAQISGAELESSVFDCTNLGCFGLAEAKNLDKIRHLDQSYLPTTTLEDCKGHLPDEFLRGCGLSEWEILSAKLYDPELKPTDIAEIQQQIFDERAKEFFLCGAFISYAHANSLFVNKVYESLKKRKVNVWLDKHDLVAGPLPRQVSDAIRIHDVVLLVLSEDSVTSDWVKWELKRARRLKKEQGRDILCPIALDDKWKDTVDADPIWDVVNDYHILDFSDWENETSFETEFEKLIEGIKRHYSDDG